MLKRVFWGLAVLFTTLSVNAQEEDENELVRDPDNKYLLWTSNVQVVEEGASQDSILLLTEVSRSESFMRTHFPYLSLCDWTPGMRFMVLPEKRDMVIRSFADYKTRKFVGNMSLRYKIFVYKGVERNDIHDRLLFQEESSNHTYYYDLPTRRFEDYCFQRKGVPALAYLGDVDSASVYLMGKQLETTHDMYNVDVTTTTYGYDKVPVHKGAIVTVKGVGVGTPKYPVKLIVEDQEGNQFFQNVMISGTNSGVAEDELTGTDDEKHTFAGSFRLIDEKQMIKNGKYSHYLGQNVITLHSTMMYNKSNVEIEIPRLVEFKIIKISMIPGSEYSELTLQKDSVLYKKKITFERKTSLTEDVIRGVRDDFFGTLFRVGTLNMKGVREENMDDIRRGNVLVGFTEEEVLLTLGEPDAHGRSSRGTAYTWVYKSMINRDQCIVYFNSKTRRVTTVRR